MKLGRPGHFHLPDSPGRAATGLNTA